MATNNGGNGGTETSDHCEWFDPQDIEIFANPRLLNNPGFLPEKMKELREGIRKDGLKQPLEVRRMPDGKIRLIAGERRLRNILMLIETEAECFNRRTSKMEKATKTYKKVPCVVTVCETEKDATRAAVLENLLHEHLTDYELLIQCETLEGGGFTRAEQAAIFDKSEAWVSQSHSLLKGNPKVLDAMSTGVLGRTQALRFLNIDPEKAEAVLEKAVKYHEMEEAQKEKDLLAEQEKLYESLDAQDTLVSAALEVGDKDAALKAKEAIREIEAKSQAVERKIKKVRSGDKRTPRPSINQIDAAAKDEAADNGPNRHMPMKTVKRTADQLTTLLSKGEKLANKTTSQEYNRREVRIIRDVLDCILNRNGMSSPLAALDTTDGDDYPEYFPETAETPEQTDDGQAA